MRHSKKLWTVLTVVVISAGVSVLCSVFLHNPREVQEIRVVPEAKTPIQYSKYEEKGFADFTYAAEVSVNAVVHVMTKYKAKQPVYNLDPFFEFFFRDRGGYQQPQPRVGTGSGVILSSDGYIVTNNHVIDGADEVMITLNDKRTFDAKLIGADPSTDLALLKIEASNLPTLAIGDSDELKIGEWVLAVGNPFNLTSTVTAGIVSAKARNINVLTADMKIESFIQTDAAVNPGNSGGALVNTRGQLVGINTAIASQTGSYAGYSFAVPVSIMSKVVADLKQYGTVQRALLGIIINDINADFAKEKNIDLLEGVYVSDVNDRSAAMDAGIRKGDILTHVHGVKVNSVSQLQEQIGRFRPGDQVKIQAVRDNKTKEFNVVLKNKMGNTNVIQEVGIKDLGVSLIPISEKQKREYSISSGLQVEKVEKGGKFARAGISQGYIILKVNNRVIHNVADVENIMKEIRENASKADEQALFISGLNANGKLTYYAVDLN